MTGKLLFAAALGLPLMLIAGAANAGPSHWYPPVKTATVASGPYADFIPAVHQDGSQCRYQGGPKGSVWHQSTLH